MRDKDGKKKKKKKSSVTQNGPKVGFVEVIEKFGHQFFLKLVYNESLFYMLHSCTNPMSWKNYVPGT